MHRSFNKASDFRRYMESLALHTGAPTVHWESKTYIFLLFKLKTLLLYLNTLTFLSILYMNNLTMVFLLQNMRSLVSCHNICAPNHIQVQLSTGVLNGWLGSDSIQPVIYNNINSIYYISLLWTKLIMGCV